MTSGDPLAITDIDAAFLEMEQKAAMLPLELSAETVEKIRSFCAQLFEYNQHTNLVSKADAPNLVREHIVDALSLVNLIIAHGTIRKLIDIGSGAGFPAMILAIAIPDLQVTFVESVGKKARFLQQVATTLGIDNRTTILNERAEDLAHKKGYREQYGYATARAVGSLALLSELTIPFLRTGGWLLAQKSQKQVEVETAEARPIITALGGDVRETVIPNTVAVGREVAIIEVVKLTPTPLKYPRPMTQIKKAK